MIQIINDIAQNGVSEKELQKVKNQKLVALYSSLETIDGKSNTLGTYEMYFGDYNKMFSAPQSYESLTVEDIQQVAKKYFTKNNSTVGYLISPENNTK